MSMRLSRSIVGEAEAEAVRRVIVDDGYLGMGETTRRFEGEIALYLGVEPWQITSVNSGTAALHLAVQAVRTDAARSGVLDKMDGPPRILVPSLTFVSTFQAITAGGCQPVACDVLTETGTLDLEDAAKRLSPNVVAVMHVDYASNPWKIDKVYEFARERGLRVIDDAAHAFGCRSRGRKIGSFGDLVCFSFDGIKNITCGEGGCVVSFREEDSRLIGDARLLGVEGDTAKRFAGERSWDPDVKNQGWRYHLSNIMAAVGSVQLKRLEKEFIPARRRLWEVYKRNLDQDRGIRLLRTDPEDYIVPHIMPVRILDGWRKKVADALDKAAIPYGTHYKPNHLLTYFGGGEISLPNTEKLYGELITLPLHPGLTDEDVEFVCETIKNVLN
ncbi:MAG: DegT/DnrJ/EryC1/StrS family aminotransferase [Desulfovibrio sp.]|nr:DegT/DnrJ/EryC1/StrS family aminotransferase [Desulfovibrio sp.]